MKKHSLQWIACLTTALVFGLGSQLSMQGYGDEEHGKGDNRDDAQSGKVDQFSDGNSGQGDDLHKGQGKGGDGTGHKPHPQGQCCDHHQRQHAFLKKFDADGDGQLNDAERAEAKEAFQARKAEFKAKRAELLKKYDADGDGRLNDEERGNAKEARQKDHPNKDRSDFSKNQEGKKSGDHRCKYPNTSKEHSSSTASSSDWTQDSDWTKGFISTKDHSNNGVRDWGRGEGFGGAGRGKGKGHGPGKSSSE